jgi:hypothetical protein
MTLEETLRTAALYGLVPLRESWLALTPEERREIGEELKDKLKLEAGALEVLIQHCKGVFPGSSLVSVRLRVAELARDESELDADEEAYAAPQIDPFEVAAEEEQFQAELGELESANAAAYAQAAEEKVAPLKIQPRGTGQKRKSRAEVRAFEATKAAVYRQAIEDKALASEAAE